MQVELLTSTPNPLLLIYATYRTSYSKQSAAEIIAHAPPKEQVVAFIQRRLQVGHTSPLEHCVFTFSIDGISRACSLQLVRHRMASYSQQSQRYVRYKSDDIAVVKPPSAQKDWTTDAYFDAAVAGAEDAYAVLTDNGVPAEDARYLLPGGMTTSMTMTVNFHALLKQADVRLCSQAQWEIRRLYALMRRRVIEVEPLLGKLLGPKCLAQRQGVCDEEYGAWESCPLGGRGSVRPHKQLVEAWVKEWRKKREE